MDYDDLLTQWLRLLREFPQQLEHQAGMFRHILIDEMQDTNALQVEIVETIAASGAGNLTAVGDDAQSIYRFRGANYDNILKFPERHSGSRRFQLDVNYRSTPQIVAFTAASIRHNRLGFPKELVSARGDGLRPVVAATADVYEEADLVCQQILEARDKDVPLGQMAILYRNHYDSVVLQGELVTRGIPYTVRSGLRFFEQAHIKDVLAYLRVVQNPRDEASWRRILLLLPGIGPAKAAAIYQQLGQSADPLATLAAAGTMAAVPPKSKGFFAAFVNDLRQIHATDPDIIRRRRSRRCSREGIRQRSGRSTTARTTGPPTWSSLPCWLPGTTASSGCWPNSCSPATCTAWIPSRPPSPRTCWS